MEFSLVYYFSFLYIGVNRYVSLKMEALFQNYNFYFQNIRLEFLISVPS